MWRFLRRQALIVAAGFVVTFLVYLFVRFDADKILLGLVIGLAGGLGLDVLILLLERWFPERPRQAN